MDRIEKSIIRYTHGAPKSAAWLTKRLHIGQDRLEEYLDGKHAKLFYYEKQDNPHKSMVSLTVDGLLMWRGSVRSEFVYSILYMPILMIAALFLLKR